LSGNGYTAAGNNFGIGLIAPGTNDNVIIDNVVTGNTNGIRLVAGVQGNFIRRNIIAGNAPVQVNASDPNAGGVDILNLAAADANTIIDNVCLTAVGATCPAVEDTLPRIVRR
jgi:parallel beta-helix repeat protein